MGPASDLQLLHAGAWWRCTLSVQTRRRCRQPWPQQGQLRRLCASAAARSLRCRPRLRMCSKCWHAALPQRRSSLTLVRSPREAAAGLRRPAAPRLVSAASLCGVSDSRQQPNRTDQCGTLQMAWMSSTTWQQ